MRIFSIYLDEAGGRVVAVKARLTETPKDLPPRPALDKAARTRRQEHYTGFPDTDPKITFLEALERIRTADNNPMVAKEIDASYVLFDQSNGQAKEKPYAAWLIVIRGLPQSLAATPIRFDKEEEEIIDTGGTIPPRPPRQGPKKIEAPVLTSDLTRYIVNANNGRLPIIADFP